MSQEIHVTRGADFGDAGNNPLTENEWLAIVETHAIEVRRAGSRLGRLDGAPIVFNDGVIAITSPSPSNIETLHAVAMAHQARMLAEGGHVLVLDGKRPPHFVRACAECSAKNRVPLFPPQGQRPKCGRCKKPMPTR